MTGTISDVHRDRGIGHILGGRQPLWNAAAGPSVVARTGGFELGILGRERHWLTLRTTNEKRPFLVLRLGDDQ